MATTFSATTDEVTFTDTDAEVVFTPAVSGPQGPVGPAGSGVADHGALTGLNDDDHPQYQHANPVITTADPFTITDESFVLTTGSAVTLPDATSAAGRTVLVGAAAVVVTVSSAGTDSINFSSGVATSYRVLVSNGVAFTSLGVGGWVVTNEHGISANLPPWYDVQAGTNSITQGHVVKMGSSAPEWGAVPAPSASDITTGTVAYARLPVGTTASTVAAGDDARLSRPPSLFASGQYTAAAITSGGNVSATNNRLWFCPIYVPRTITVDRIGAVHSIASASSGSIARLGIYTSSGDLPSTLLLDAGSIDLSTGVALKTITISQQLTPGVYWLAIVAQFTGTTPSFTAAGTPAIAVPDGASTFTGFKFESQSGALPATATPGTANSTQAPAVFLRMFQ